MSSKGRSCAFCSEVSERICFGCHSEVCEKYHYAAGTGLCINCNKARGPTCFICQAPAIGACQSCRKPMCGQHQNENYQCCRDCLPALMQSSLSKGRQNADALYAQQEAERLARRSRVRAAAAVPPLPVPVESAASAKGGAEVFSIHDDEEWEGEGDEEEPPEGWQLFGNGDDEKEEQGGDDDPSDRRRRRRQPPE